MPISLNLLWSGSCIASLPSSISAHILLSRRKEYDEPHPTSSYFNMSFSDGGAPCSSHSLLARRLLGPARSRSCWIHVDQSRFAVGIATWTGEYFDNITSTQVDRSSIQCDNMKHESRCYALYGWLSYLPNCCVFVVCLW